MNVYVAYGPMILSSRPLIGYLNGVGGASEVWVRRYGCCVLYRLDRIVHQNYVNRELPIKYMCAVCVEIHEYRRIVLSLFLGARWNYEEWWKGKRQCGALRSGSSSPKLGCCYYHVPTNAHILAFRVSLCRLLSGLVERVTLPKIFRPLFSHM